jgi:cellular nucleic acid-binding protein
MSKYGVENVRGGSYCRITLPDESLNALKRELEGSEGRCYKCGKSGHYAQSCTPRHISDTKRPGEVTIKKMACARCGRNTHSAMSCYAKTRLNAYIKSNRQTSEPTRPNIEL